MANVLVENQSLVDIAVSIYIEGIGDFSRTH